MNIWIDAQLSPALAVWITANFVGLSAVAVRDLGLREADDETIFFCGKGGRCDGDEQG